MLNDPLFLVVKNPYDLRSEEIKLLGVSSDKDLHFSKHIGSYRGTKI